MKEGMDERRYLSLRGFIRLMRRQHEKEDFSGALMSLKDDLAQRAFGMKPGEAHQKSICISCKEPVQKELLPTEAAKKEYEMTALCPKCWERLFPDTE